MARIGVMSDLHNEFERVRCPARPSAAWFALGAARLASRGHPELGPYLGPLRDAGLDLLVMAGDIDRGRNAVAYAAEVARYVDVPVVAVHGNHEAYDADLTELIRQLRADALDTEGRVRFLEQAVTAFDLPDGRLHVVGCCLWTDYALLGGTEADLAQAMRAAQAGLYDHRRITYRDRVFQPEDALQLHRASRLWLSKAVADIREAEGKDARIIVVTHHAPVAAATPPQYRGSPLSPAFTSDLSAEIAALRPIAWIFGHTHHSVDLMHGPTRIVSAQRGYLGAEPGADSFTPMVLEI